jgi:hypothetical protein
MKIEKHWLKNVLWSSASLDSSYKWFIYIRKVSIKFHDSPQFCLNHRCRNRSKLIVSDKLKSHKNQWDPVIGYKWEKTQRWSCNLVRFWFDIDRIWFSMFDSEEVKEIIWLQISKYKDYITSYLTHLAIFNLKKNQKSMLVYEQLCVVHLLPKEMLNRKWVKKTREYIL